MSALSKPLSILLALGVAACASSGAATDTMPDAGPVADAPAPTTTAASAATGGGGGHFTAAQADAGRDTFRGLCTECHFSGEFSDEQFKFKWSRRAADDLYDLIYTQMPESAPGSLSPEEAVSLVSYILRMNGFEEGSTDLAPDPDVLAGISLRPIRN
jgi:hypothetical protein